MSTNLPCFLVCVLLVDELICDIKREDFAGEVNFEFCICCISFNITLKWHLIYQSWSRHSNFTIKKGSKILIVQIIFWIFSSISNKKTHKIPPFQHAVSQMITLALYRKTTWPSTVQNYIVGISKLQLQDYQTIS